jgi:hypothetical protein
MSNNLKKQKTKRQEPSDLVFDLRIRSYDKDDGSDQIETTTHYGVQYICPLCQIGVMTTVLAGMILETEADEGIAKGDLLKSVLEEITGKHEDMDGYVPKDHHNNLN